MAKTLSLFEVKTRLPELVAGVHEREKEVVVDEEWAACCSADRCRGVYAAEREAGRADRSCLDETDRSKQVIR